MLLLLMLHRASAQELLPGTGQWRGHASYRETRLCESAGQYVYVASRNGFFRIDAATAEIEKLTRAEGFYAIGITALRYFPAKGILVIGYANGLIELLRDNGRLEEIPGLRNKLLQGDKSILHIAAGSAGQAILSTSFGILVVDMDKAEIRDSYTAIGPGGQTLAVTSTTLVGDSIYAGLTDGIIRARYSSSVNLNDFNNWKRVYTGKPCTQLHGFGDTLFFASDSQVYSMHAGSARLRITEKRNTGRIQVYGQSLHVFRGGGIFQFGNTGQSRRQVNILADGCMANSGMYWFCTGIGPAIVRLEENAEYSFEPTGPSGNPVFSMTKGGNLLFTSAGGVSNTFGNAYNPTGFYTFSNDKGWINNPASAFNTGLYDYTFVHHNPVTGKTYVGTHVNGMLEYRGLSALNRWDATNSTLQKTPVVDMVRVSGIASDRKGNLWVTNFGSPGAGLHMMNRSGAWTAINIPSTDVGPLMIDQNGYKWMILIAGGILVYDDNNTPANALDDRSVTLTTRNGLITNEVLSLACDSSGYVWIGTSQGLNVFTNPDDVFRGGSADRLIIRQNGEDGYLMGEETIHDICVDGGNRKWFATNNGVFLVDANGQQVLANFRENNSPLPDDRVLCIGQMDETGEVFFGTESGIISYRSDASAAGEQFSGIRIYPNPVRPGYSGPITIDGLAKDAEIRITDASGQVVYRTRANGGTATWNGLRLNGTRPNSGVYFVFAINTDGSETEMGRFIFIN